LPAVLRIQQRGGRCARGALVEPRAGGLVEPGWSCRCTGPGSCGGRANQKPAGAFIRAAPTWVAPGSV